MAKTYGEKPIIFSFEEGGEEYMIGSEVNLDFKVKWYVIKSLKFVGGKLFEVVPWSSI